MGAGEDREQRERIQLRELGPFVLQARVQRGSINHPVSLSISEEPKIQVKSGVNIFFSSHLLKLPICTSLLLLLHPRANSALSSVPLFLSHSPSPPPCVCTVPQEAASNHALPHTVLAVSPQLLLKQNLRSSYSRVHHITKGCGHSKAANTHARLLEVPLATALPSGNDSCRPSHKSCLPWWL